MNLHRIKLTTLAFNKRALSAYQKAGFHEEGRRRDSVFHNSAYQDEITMSVLATEPR